MTGFRPTAPLAVLGCFAVLLGSHTARGDEIQFNRDVRPILSENCYECHGPDGKKRKKGLRFDIREGAMKDLGGYRAIVPGKPAESEMIRRITADDPDERMPPPDSGKELTDEEIATLRQWIEEGAEWERHWSFQPIEQPELPSVDHADWPRNPIDRFILAKLEANGLEPSPTADRRTLIRRLYVDLLGLAPPPEAVARFVHDDRPNAYRRLVDRVLSNPHYGERWGRHWLDQARYADSHGYTIDSPRSMWPWRDWVIDAFNRDMPFDRFTVEQIAGDLLPDPSRSQLVATGFHRNTLINQEGGTNDEEFRVEATVDRVNTTGQVWLALTVGCAKCHSHKFDPISQVEYYQLYAFFNDAKDRNSVSPKIRLPSPKQKKRMRTLEKKLADAKEALKARDKAIADRRETWEKRYARPTDWTVVDPDHASSKAGATLKELDDRSLLAKGTNAKADRYTIRAASPKKTITAVRLETLTHESLPKGGPGRAGNGNFVLNQITLRGPDGKSLPWSRAMADHSQPNYGVGRAIDGEVETKSGWAINVRDGDMNVDRTAVFVLKEPLKLETGATVTVELHFGPRPSSYQIGRLRLSVTAAEYPHLGEEDPIRKILRMPEEERSKEQKKKVEKAFKRSDPKRVKLAKRVDELKQKKKELRSSIPTTMIMRDRKEPRETHVHIRGRFRDKGKKVQPGVPDVLHDLENSDGGRPNRLDLARWLVDEDNPLTARVRVNRMWMRYFGRGLVETENDFGTQGTRPTHPALLDWLAAELMRRGWSMKAVHRLIVTSATYRQRSRSRPAIRKKDPRNKLLAKQARFRVAGEVVRDLALSASGLLVERIGGPSVYPPQPDGVYAFTQRKQSWPTDQGADRYRRGLYTFFYRSAPYPMLTTFDAPRFNKTCTRRPRSNTPLQALTLANDKAMFEMAQALGRRILREAPSAGDEGKIRHAFRLALSRPPRKEELSRMKSFLDQQRRRFEKAPAAAAEAAGTEKKGPETVEAAAWTAVGRVLINLDEFITRE